MARVTQQDKDDFQAALAELERLLRGNRTEIDLVVKKVADDAAESASRAFLVNPSGATFQAATSAMEVIELFV
jgi:hypothetical protein